MSNGLSPVGQKVINVVVDGIFLTIAATYIVVLAAYFGFVGYVFFTETIPSLWRPPYERIDFYTARRNLDIMFAGFQAILLLSVGLFVSFILFMVFSRSKLSKLFNNESRT